MDLELYIFSVSVLDPGALKCEVAGEDLRLGDALITDFLQDRQSFKFLIRHKHQHIKPYASIITKASILYLEKPDISILELQVVLRIM